MSIHIVSHPTFVVSEENDIKIDRCLRCEYELKGLPEECTCPECGLEHDANAFSFHFVRESRYVLYVTIYTTLYSYIVLITDNKPLQWKNLILVFLALFGTAAILNYLFSLSDRQSFMIVNQAGLHFHMPGRNDRTIQWNEIGSISQSRFTARMRVYNPNGKKIYSASYNRFKSSKYISECITDIERMKKVYTQS